MPRTAIVLKCVLLALLTGVPACTHSSAGSAPGLIILVPGVAGDGAWYRNVVPALRDCGDQRTVESFAWGAPGFAFFMNFNNVSIHESAERKLADRLVQYRKDHPAERVDLIGHSAGGGVVLGALAKLPPGVHVGKVILLHPSVSPGYALSKPLTACESIVLFHSGRDKTFLDWRTSHFGTYDNVKTKAAGNAGFNLAGLSEAECTRVHQVAYLDDEKALGNDGDHFGALARQYLRERVMPRLATDSPDAAAKPSVPAQ